MSRWGSLAAVTVGGAALAFAFPEPDVAPLAWVSLAPLLLTLSDAPARRGFGLGFTFGIAFFGVLLYWISIIGWAGWLILVLLQALYIGGFGAVYASVSRRLPGAARVLAAGAIWVVFEFVRTKFPLGGFTWGQLAQSQHNVGLLEFAGFAGSWGIAFLLVSCNAALAEATRTWRERRIRAIAYASVAVIGIAAPMLLSRAHSEVDADALRVAIVQGNVPRDFAGSTFDKEISIINSHVRLTKTLANEDVDLVVWPESSVGIDIENDDTVAGAVTAAAQGANAPMIIGGNLDVGTDEYKVMAFQVSPEGEIVDRYQKTHLVPFGEFVPARDALDWLPILDQVPRDAIPGDQKTIFTVGNIKVAPVISFEGDFGSLVRDRIAAGGEVLVVATNTSTWEESWASAQHVAFSQVRAAENGVPVVHAALSGISAFIRPDGVVTERTPLWTSTTAVQGVTSGEPTFYARTGDWLPWLSLVMMVGLGIWAYVRRGNESPADDPNTKGEPNDG